jgi:hypothetical protein
MLWHPHEEAERMEPIRAIVAAPVLPMIHAGGGPA